MNSSLWSWALKIGRIQGIPIELHWTFFVYVIMKISEASDGRLMALVMVVLFATVLLHELGHCWAARHYGLEARRIVLWPLGGLAYVTPGRSAAQEIGVAVAGPFMHIPIAVAGCAWLATQNVHLTTDLFNPLGGYPLGADTYWTFFVCQVVKMQVMLFCFNLFLPAYPMDGGRVLVAVLSTRTTIENTALTACVLSSVIGLGMIVTGVSWMIGLLLLLEAFQLNQLRLQGGLRRHPMFQAATFGGRPQIKGKKAAPVGDRMFAKQFSKTCPGCQRELPISARMCGFCERPV